jgi:hypothetical protein
VTRPPLALGALVLLLAGCTATTPTQVPRSSSAAVPAFPRIDGAVLSTSQPVAGDWVVRVQVREPGAAYLRARSLLTAHGYRLTSDETDQDGGHGQACTTALCVSFATSGGGASGGTLDYEVFHSTGMAG